MEEDKKEEIEIVKVTEELIKAKTYEVRGYKVMLDFDLAKIYGYSTKAFNQQVKNNSERFASDFAFKLTKEEVNNLRSKNLTSSWGGSRYLPNAFTEQGIYMLMTIHFHEDGLNRRWNSTQENWINIGDEDAEDQIGSVFAVQGIDLNKVGVMIGPDIRVNEDGKLEAVPDNHNNTNNKFSVEEMTDPMNQFEFTLYILNQYYVLLTRGIDGIRLGFWDGNDSFRKYMEDTLDIGA